MLPKEIGRKRENTMKYLFFDIECSNCFDKVGKMCEFGYVLTDEEFNILKKDDIPMSPGKGRENRFYLKGRKHEKDLELAYEYDYYQEQPEFPCFYKAIEKLICDPDTICFAFSMENDILHLFNSCKRYGCKQLNYYCYDVQRFATEYLESDKLINLTNACLKIVGPNSRLDLNPHLSRDDAIATMRVFKAICELEKVSSKEYLNNHSSFGGKNTTYIESYFKRLKEKCEKTEGYRLFDSIRVDESEASKPDYIGKRYEVSSMLKRNQEHLQNIIEYVKNNGGIIIDKVDLGDYFIVLDEANKQEMIEKVGAHFHGKYITIDELNN